MTASLDIYQTHQGFFDLDSVRQTGGDIARLSDDDLVQLLLDPKTTAPPAPNFIFDPAYYARNYMTRDDGGSANPISHYLVSGAAKDAAPNALFDPLFFARNAGPAAARFPTLVECALKRSKTGLPAFHPFIDARFVQRALGVLDTGLFLRDLFAGKLDIRQSHPLFDVDFIRDQADRDINNLTDAIAWYWHCGRDVATHPLFDVAFYKSKFPSEETIKHSVFHYLISPCPHSAQPLLDVAFYQERALAADVVVAGRALEHFITEGQYLGLNPSPYFDVEYYRRQSQCGPDALQHYVVEGHKRFSPHPLIRASEGRLFARALGQCDLSVAARLACLSQDVALSVTPDVDPGFLDRVSKVSCQSPRVLRDAYFRHGCFEGNRPNGLLSLPYITARAEMLQNAGDVTFASYFGQGGHLGKRVMVALETLDDTPANRGWLTVLQSQISNPDFEFILVGGRSGALASEFHDLAHVWLLSNHTAKHPSLGTLIQSGKRLSEVAAANPPVSVLAEMNHSIDMAIAVSQMGCPMILFGGAGLAEAVTGNAPFLTQKAAHILCPSEQIKALVDRQFEAGQDCATSVFEVSPTTAYRAIAPQTDRAETRKSLGLPGDAIIVLGSGDMDLSNSVDLFGAVASKCLRQPDCSADVHFIWHGEGPQVPNTPAFYAMYFVATFVDPDRIRFIAEPGLNDLLSTADIYMKFCRDCADLSGVAEAKAAGLPVVVSCDQPDDGDKTKEIGTVLVGRFDTQAASDALLRLIGSAPGRQRLGAAAHKGVKTNDGFVRFVDQINSVFSEASIDVQLAPVPFAPSGESVLIVADEEIANTLFGDRGPVRRFRGREISSIDPSQLAPGTAVDRKFGHLDLTDKTHIVLFEGTDGLTPAFIAEFGRAIWLIEGLLAQLDDVYRLGLTFDDIKVRNQDAINEMAGLNPKIAKIMSVFRTGQP